MSAPLDYRSLSFHESWPNLELIRLGRELGFNDLTFQTEGGTVPRWEDLRDRADRIGYFRLAEELGYTITVWAHEFNELDSGWGELSTDNAALWRGLEARYDRLLTRVIPEANHLALTVVETAADATRPDLLSRLVEVLHGVCARNGRRLIVRTFVHHPAQQEEVAAAIRGFPSDLVVMTKCVPQDWHLRHIDHPLLGNVGGRRQYVECDIAGEYWREDHLANAFTPLLEHRFAHWRDCGIEGISVRVDRGWKPWARQACVLNEVQEANLWTLGLLASGAVTDANEAWRRYAARRFGDRAAESAIAALQPTGAVVAESLCCGRETFGNGRQRVPAIETMRNHLDAPGVTMRNGRPVARAYESADDTLGRSPFHRNWSVFRWAPELRPEYERLRRGDPAAIEEKTVGEAAAMRSAEASVAAWDEARDVLPAGAYTYFRFRLDENRLHLVAMLEMELAWMEAERRLYGENDAERRDLLASIRRRLSILEVLRRGHGDEILRCTWAGRHRELRRFACLDIGAFAKEFRGYFEIGD